jgi:uncharacterized ion transporter superfamily protein YfcC
MRNRQMNKTMIIILCALVVVASVFSYVVYSGQYIPYLFPGTVIDDDGFASYPTTDESRQLYYDGYMRGTSLSPTEAHRQIADNLGISMEQVARLAQCSSVGLVVVSPIVYP